jgi:pyrroline-5-carboxylate reductase
MMKIAVIGCGNMARAMVTQVHTKDKDISFFTYTPSGTRARALAKEVSGQAVETLEEIPNCDLYLIACKPQQLTDLALNLKGKLIDKNIVSVLAAINLKTLSEKLQSKNIIRVMPNTPSEIGLGVSLCISHTKASTEGFELAKRFLSPCGEVIELGKEKELDELTIFSGCGPAYLYRFALAYEKEMVTLGYDKSLARRLIEQTFLGSAQLMKNSELEISTLIDNVTSKGGVTIEAVKVLELNGLDKIVSDSVVAAKLRTEQMSQET